MAKVSTNGPMGKYMMENGTKVSNMAMEFGKAYMETATLENGSIQELMAMESILGATGIGMKANGKHVSNMAMVPTFSQTEIFT